MSTITDNHDHTPTGFRRWAYSTNHKDIGSMYIIFAVIAGVIGGIMSMIMRTELAFPGDGILGGDYQMYNVLTTAHGLIMIFFYDYACYDWRIWKLVCANYDRCS